MVATLAQILERPGAYRLWQAPFAERKFAPVRAHNDLGAVRRVLDVACGPGTSVRHFPDAEYVGLDLNRPYVVDARRRTGRPFAVADALKLPIASGRFDFVLVNSFLHHVAEAGVHQILADLTRVLSDQGHVHVLELVLPEQPSIARLLARLDRGKYARSVAHWRGLFHAHFEGCVLQPYTLDLGGTALWHMVYFKGRRRRG